MSDQSALERLLRHTSGQPGLELTNGVGGELFVEIDADCLVDAVSSLGEEHLHHLSAITALDDGEQIHVLYHLWVGVGLTLRISCSREAPSVPSLTGVCTAALWYEREAHEMLGIAFEGHPDLAPLLLPEEWSGPPPLRQADEP